MIPICRACFTSRPRLVEARELEKVRLQRRDLGKDGRIVIGRGIHALVVEHRGSLFLDFVHEGLGKSLTEGFLVVQRHHGFGVQLLHSELGLDHSFQRVVSREADEVGQVEGGELGRAGIVAEQGDVRLLQNADGRYGHVTVEESDHRVYMLADELLRSCHAGCGIRLGVPPDDFDLAAEDSAVGVDVVHRELFGILGSHPIRGVAPREGKADPKDEVLARSARASSECDRGQHGYARRDG